MSRLRSVVRWSLPFVGALLLVACGGGSDNDSPPPPPPPPAPSNLSYTAPPVLTIGTAMTAVTPTVTGSPTAFTVSPALPAGIALNGTTGAISGTPTAPQAATNHIVTASNAGGSTTATVSIRVNDLPPSVAYPRTSYGFSTNVPVTVTPSVTGGAVTAWSVSPALPAGLSISSTTGVITGSPTQITANAPYVVTAQNSGGNDTFDLNLGVQSDVLLDYGHAYELVEIKQNATRILSRDTAGNISLFNSQTGQKLMGTRTSGIFDAATLWLCDDTAIVYNGHDFEIRAAVDGSIISVVDVGNLFYGVANDCSYVWRTNHLEFRVWSRAGQLLFTRDNDAYRGAKLIGMPGELRIAGGPAAPNGVETISVPGGVSNIAPGTFSGVFYKWLSDGSGFLTTAGNSLWVYSPTVVQQDFRQPSTLAGLDGRGNRFWTFANNTLNVYAVGASSSPLATYAFGGTNAGRISAAGNTLVFVNDTDNFSIIDVGQATPARTDHNTSPMAVVSAGAASPTDWSVGDSRGVMVGEPPSGGGNPVSYSIGRIKALAAGAQHTAVATSLGTTRIYDTQTRELVREETFPASQVQMSADGSVLAAFVPSNDFGNGQLTIYSLPSMSVLRSFDLENTGLSLQQFKLADSGQFLVIATGSSVVDEFARSVVRLDGTVIWSDTVHWEYNVFPRSPFPMPKVSPDGLTIAVPPNELSFAQGSDIYRNGSLLTTLVGFASGWLNNNRIVMSQYVYDTHAMAWDPGVCQIVDLGQSPVTCASSAHRGVGQVASETSAYSFYSLNSSSNNSIRDFFTGQITWQSAAPITTTVPNFGSLAGNWVVFTSTTQVRIEPR
jgi:hypothetical protein